MDIYIISGKEQIRLPVMPESYELTAKYNHQTAEIVTLGEISLKGTKGLESLSLTSFFPGSKTHGGYETHGKFKEPFLLVNKLKNLAGKGSVVRVIITETNVNSEFLITDFSHSQTGGSGDVDYTISLTQYRVPSITATKNGKTLKSRSSKPSPTYYTVKSGDSLKSIAKACLGSSKKFKQIAQLNFIDAPYKVRVGQVLVIDNLK